MAWTAPTTRTTGELITASIWNTDLVDDLVALRSGGIAIASQAALDFIYGASATQLARLVKGSALQVPRINAAANAWEFATIGTPGWEFVSYTTATAAATITVSSLNLNTDLSYQFILETTDFGAAEGITARVNADATADSTSIGIGTATAVGGTNINDVAGATQITLYAAATHFSWSGQVCVNLTRDGRPLVNFQMAGLRATNVGDVAVATGTGIKNATTNMTSMQFRSLNGNTANWRVWCFRARQS